MTTQPQLPEWPPLRLTPLVRAAPPPRTDEDFVAFVEHHEQRLRRLILRRLGDSGDADEITQETLLRAYQHREALATEDELMAWCTVVAQRLVIDRMRVRGRSVAVADVPETARLGRDTAEIVVARHEARAALEALEALPTRQAAILWAREVEGLRYDDIARRFRITEPAVRSLLHRGRKALRHEFKARTGTLPLGGLVPFAPWLVALRAASQVRRAAKTATTSSGPAMAGLLVLGVTALSTIWWLPQPHGDAAAFPPVPVQERAMPAPADPLDPRAEAVEARSGSRRPGIGGSGGSSGTGPRATVAACGDDCRVVISGQPTRDGITVWVGPWLPDNPTGIRRVGGHLKTGPVQPECPRMLESSVLSCSAHYSEDDGDAASSPAANTPAPPSTSGVVR